MTPITHTIEAGEILGARTWILRQRTLPALPDIPSKFFAKSDSILITDFGLKIKHEQVLISGPGGIYASDFWPKEEKLQAKCLKNNREPATYNCVDDCGAPCTQRMNAFQGGSYASCPCGIYAYNFHGAVDRGDLFFRVDTHRVVGLVALSGRVVEHDLGYRAEFARPFAILPPRQPSAHDAINHPSFTNCKRLARNVAEGYNIPLIKDFAKLLIILMEDQKRREGEGDLDQCP